MYRCAFSLAGFIRAAGAPACNRRLNAARTAHLLARRILVQVARRATIASLC